MPYAGIAALLLCLNGCKNAQHAYERVHERVHRQAIARAAAEVPGRIAQLGYESITSACAHETFVNARQGLVAGVTGLNEDVFELRDAMSHATLAFRLDEAQRLESMLQSAARSTSEPSEETGCIARFEDYFESLTTPVVQAAEARQQLDLSALDGSASHAQEELEKEQQMEQAKEAVQKQ